MSGRKALAKQITKTELDIETGEIRTITEEKILGFTDTEPDYIKIYVGTQLCLNDIDPTLAPYIVAFGPYMTYANDERYTHMVSTNQVCRAGVARTLGVSDIRVKQIIKKLTDVSIFIPIYDTNGKRYKGVYFVNPYIIAKGKWQDIKFLRQQIDWKVGESSYYIEDEYGNRRITSKLPTKKRQLTENQQMTLEDYADEYTDTEGTI